ncbi:hypothetical protein LTS18_007257 [Coniosporium uncinatum]|uniref:Uncharacterized protein n=1 Tax=Coniosporium uncinatum TaxID=93489 RepID=A0ACC3D372_9PEZI|nr:hypothetical protein LTS18_007257 [Coniosporium uncinatum]
MSSSTSQSTSPTNKIISFYDPQISAPDHADRTLDSIITWPDSRLEQSHNYIQVLFPLPEGSPYNSQAPIVTEEVFHAFRERSELRSQLKKSFERICRFYGFEATTGEGKEEESTVKLTLAQDYDDAFENWFRSFDHNHLRLTRILRSLRVLGLEAEAAALWTILQRVCAEKPGVVSKKSQMFWRRAAERELHVPPDVDEVTVETGEGWLREWVGR